MSLQGLADLSVKGSTIGLALARVSALLTIIRDPRLTFATLSMLAHRLIIVACSDASVAIGKGYTSSGAILHLKQCLDTIGARQYVREACSGRSTPRPQSAGAPQLVAPLGSRDGASVLLSDMDQRDLIMLLPAVVEACYAAKEHLSSVLSAIAASTQEVLNQALHGGGGGRPKVADLVGRAWVAVGEHTHSTALFASGCSLLTGRGGLHVLDTMLSRHVLLSFVSLSGCAIADEAFASLLLPSLAALPCLQSLDVSANALTDESARQLLALLGAAKRGAGSFPRLEAADVRGNLFLDVSAVQSEVTRALTASHRGGGPPFRVLVLDGVGMEAVAIPKAFAGMGEGWLDAQPQLGAAVAVGEGAGDDCAPGGAALSVDLVAASSFGAVVAAAVVARVPMRRIEAFFAAVAANVFADFDYSGNYAYGGYRVVPGDGLLSAARWARRWYSGGNFYNWEAFVAALDALFGADLLAMPLVEFGAKFSSAPRLLLVARSGAHGGLRVYRTYADLVHGQKVPEEAAGPLSCTLREALESCCAVPGYFAPRSSSLGMQYVDAMCSSLEVALAEASQRAKALSCIRVCVVSPERPTPLPLPETPSTLAIHGGDCADGGAVVGTDHRRTCFDAEALTHAALNAAREAHTVTRLVSQSSLGSLFTTIGVEHLPKDHWLPDLRRRDAQWQRSLARSMLTSPLLSRLGSNSGGPGGRDRFTILPLLRPSGTLLAHGAGIAVNEHDRELLEGLEVAQLGVADLAKCLA